jgi:NADH-quinone oxidoreductase subunit I
MAVIRPFLLGFATTFKHLFKKPITVNYPDEKFPMFPKYRGKQVLMRDENGLEKCVACGLCSVACPADAIYLEAAENDGTVQAGPRYASVYQIHKTRCIFCGYCEEACPVGAIFMGKDYELAVYSKDDFVWDKADLLVPASTTAATATRSTWLHNLGRPASAGLQVRLKADTTSVLKPADPAHADRRPRRHPR